MYGTTWCSDCLRTKVFFNFNNIPFEYINIEKDDAARKYVVNVNPEGNQSVPVIEIEGVNEILIEPTISKLKEILNI